MGRISLLLTLVVLAVQIAIAQSASSGSNPNERQADGPEKVPPEEANRPLQMLGMETKPGFSDGIVDLATQPGAKLLLENDYVRAYRVDLPAQGNLNMHWHRLDSMIFHLGEFQVNEFVIEPKDRKLRRIDLTLYKRVRSGSDFAVPTAIAAGMIHIITETGWKPYHGVEIELKHNKGKGHIQMQPLAPGETVRIEAMAKQNHLMVVQQPQELSEEADGVPVTKLTQDAGEVKWYPAGKARSFTNAGNKTVILTLVPCY